MAVRTSRRFFSASRCSRLSSSLTSIPPDEKQAPMAAIKICTDYVTRLERTSAAVIKEENHEEGDDGAESGRDGMGVRERCEKLRSEG